MKQTKSFTNVEDMIKAILSYPRRITISDDSDSLGFESDDRVRFSIGLLDYGYSIKDDEPYRVKKFREAMSTYKGKENFCEFVNYGKPDFETKE